MTHRTPARSSRGSSWSTAKRSCDSIREEPKYLGTRPAVQGVVQDRGWVHSHTANQTGSITRPALSTRRSRSSAGAAFGPRSGRPGRYGARPDRPPAFALDQPVTTPRPAVDTGSANWRWGHKNLLAPLRDDPLKSAKRQHDVSRTRGRDLLQELPHFRTKDPYLRVSLRAAPYAATITMPSRRL